MTHANLIEALIGGGYLKTPRIIEAFKKIDRKNFVPPECKDDGYGNYPLPIGFGQTISQPLTVAFMLELFEPKPGEKILDIGSGSGWQTTLLAYIVSKERNQKSKVKNQNEGMIVAIERVPELKEMTETNVSKYNFISKKIVEVILGDGSKGCPNEAPFDKIIVAAAIQFPRLSASSPRKSAAVDNISREWKEQLKVGGRIVAPVNQSIFVFDKISDNEFQEKEYFGFSFVPLVSS